MEAIALADMFHFMYDERKCLVITIVTDDDSKMKAAMRWSNEDHEKHYGVKLYMSTARPLEKGEYVAIVDCFATH